MHNNSGKIRFYKHNSLTNRKLNKINRTAKEMNKPFNNYRNNIHTHGYTNGITTQRIANPMRSKIDSSKHCRKGEQESKEVSRYGVKYPSNDSCLSITSCCQTYLSAVSRWECRIRDILSKRNNTLIDVIFGRPCSSKKVFQRFCK